MEAKLKRKTYQDEALKRAIRFQTTEILAEAQRRAREQGMSLTSYINELCRRDQKKRW